MIQHRQREERSVLLLRERLVTKDLKKNDKN